MYQEQEEDIFQLSKHTKELDKQLEDELDYQLIDPNVRGLILHNDNVEPTAPRVIQDNQGHTQGSEQPIPAPVQPIAVQQAPNHNPPPPSPTQDLQGQVVDLTLAVVSTNRENMALKKALTAAKEEVATAKRETQIAKAEAKKQMSSAGVAQREARIAQKEVKDAKEQVHLLKLGLYEAKDRAKKAEAQLAASENMKSSAILASAQMQHQHQIELSNLHRALHQAHQENATLQQMLFMGMRPPQALAFTEQYNQSLHPIMLTPLLLQQNNQTEGQVASTSNDHRLLPSITNLWTLMPEKPASTHNNNNTALINNTLPATQPQNTQMFEPHINSNNNNNNNPLKRTNETRGRKSKKPKS